MSATAVAESPTATVTYVCCGNRLGYVKLTGLAARLSFTHCNCCQATRWYRGDIPIDPTSAMSLPELPPHRVVGQS